MAVSQASHLLRRLVTPVPLTQLPQRKPVGEREREAAHANLHWIQQEHNGTYIYTRNGRQMRGQHTHADLTKVEREGASVIEQ